MKQMFEIGEVVITQGHKRSEDNGIEVTVAGPLRWGLAHDCYTKAVLPPSFRYPVEWPGRNIQHQPYWMLRKRYNPPDLDSISLDQDICA
jgi:hypothetical protein